MKMCEYKFCNGERCKEKTLPNSKYCVLHIDFPEDEESEKFKQTVDLKQQKLKEKVSKKDFNFEGARLLKVDFSKMEIEGNLNFINATIGKRDWSNEENGDVLLEKAQVKGDVLFSGAMLLGCVSGDGAKISESVRFDGTITGQGISFYNANIGGLLAIANSEIGRNPFGGSVIFNDARIDVGIGLTSSEIHGDVWFEGAIIGGDGFLFEDVKIAGSLLFTGTKFQDHGVQELACRKAKGILGRLGDKEGADYHFYREMEAKREQKHPVIRFLELPVQYIFGYGVYPLRVIATWLLTVFSLAFVYWLGNGVEAANSLLEYIYFSVVTAATPGYGGYHPKPGFYQGLASFEAIFGTFMWAAFIATFARKYMR